MILVDIGNSGLRAVKISLDQPLPLNDVWRLSWPADFSVHGKRVPQQTSEPRQKWCEADDADAFDWLVQKVDGSNENWLVSSVRQRALDHLSSSIQRLGGNSRLRTISFKDLEMSIDVDAPHRVGIDRLLASWEAWHQVNGAEASSKPVVVVQAGTAVTVDLVSVDMTFCGGSIMPGLGLALQLLAAGTDQLPWLDNHSVNTEPKLPGKNTHQAIVAGVHASLAGGAAFLVNRYREEQGHSILPVVISGGDATIITPYIPNPVIPLDHLVLRGLYRLSQLKARTFWT